MVWRMEVPEVLVQVEAEAELEEGLLEIEVCLQSCPSLLICFFFF